MTAKKRMVAKLRRSRLNFNTGGIIVRVRWASGFGRFSKVTTNTTLCPATRVSYAFFWRRVCVLWRSNFVRRSQREQMRWERLFPLLDRWIPQPRVLHPYPDKRFDAIHPNWRMEPGSNARSSLVAGGPLHAIDDEDFNRTLCGFEF
jgi:hypothetical protein